MNDLEMATYAYVAETARTVNMGEIVSAVSELTHERYDTVQRTFTDMVLRTKQITEYYDDNVEGWRYKPSERF